MSEVAFQKVAECLYRHTPSGSYYAIIKLKGKQIKRKLEAESLPEAKRKLRDFKDEQTRLKPGVARMTVGELCDRYAGGITHQAARTIRRKTDILRRIRTRFGETKARSVQQSEVMEWLASFKFGPASYHLHLEQIQAVFKLGLADGVIPANPAQGIARPKRAKPIRRTPSRAEFAAIVASIRKQPFSDTREESADYVEFMGLAGLGQAELSAMTWGDVRQDKQHILVQRVKTGAGYVVPVFPQLRPLLERRLAQATEANGGQPPRPDTRVFSVADAKKAIDGACQRLNLPRYSSRSFRRMFITRAIENLVDIKVIARWQGHKDGGKLILDTYSHVRPEHDDAMALRMTMDEPANIVPITAAVAA